MSSYSKDKDIEHMDITRQAENITSRETSSSFPADRHYQQEEGDEDEDEAPPVIVGATPQHQQQQGRGGGRRERAGIHLLLANASSPSLCMEETNKKRDLELISSSSLDSMDVVEEETNILHKIKKKRRIYDSTTSGRTQNQDAEQRKETIAFAYCKSSNRSEEMIEESILSVLPSPPSSRDDEGINYEEERERKKSIEQVKVEEKLPNIHINKQKEKQRNDIGSCSPNKYDVLCGRGAGINHHFGNINYRHLLKKYTNEYSAASRAREKRLIVATIITAIESKGGRFLKRTSDESNSMSNYESSSHSSLASSSWMPISEEEVMRKTAQGLRDMRDRHKEKELEEHKEEELLLKLTSMMNDDDDKNKRCDISFRPKHRISSSDHSRNHRIEVLRQKIDFTQTKINQLKEEQDSLERQQRKMIQDLFGEINSSGLHDNHHIEYADARRRPMPDDDSDNRCL